MTPVLFVHGFRSSPAMWTGGTFKIPGNQKPSKIDRPTVERTNETLAEMVSKKGRTAALTFDYTPSSTQWVTDRTIGYRLADTISCLKRATGRKVIVIAHSMGGLATQWAASREGGNVGSEIASVTTLGTPFKGSWLTQCDTSPEKNTDRCRLLNSIITPCQGVIQHPPHGYGQPRREWGLVPTFCQMLPTPDDAKNPAGRALGAKDSSIRNLPDWPSGKGAPKINKMASQLVNLPKGWPDVGDLAVTTDSATAGNGKKFIFQDWRYHHLTMHRNPKLAKTVVKIVNDSAPLQPPRKIDWRNRSYDLTCDDTVKKPVKVSLRHGSGVAKDNIDKAHDHWEVNVQKVTHGSLPRLGSVTAVLFSCSPQPSNFSKQELRVYRSGDGREVGRTPTFHVNTLSPQYQPQSVAIKDGRLHSDVAFYEPNDTHASGPSSRRHITWTWNGKELKEDISQRQAPMRLDVNRDRLTVNGLGPLKIGMTHAEAEKAVSAPITTEQRGASCSDDRVQGAPDGLSLRFANDRLVAIAVTPPATTVSTASGIRIGSTRDEVLKTYSSEVTASPGVQGDEELVFAPTRAQFAGKVIVFGVDHGSVALFIAGEREWATLAGPCGGD
ncbi:esterase/lipase family protein [Streptomyces lydicus]|uniref:esterase/lipase family protein n=1 Tax=Streptomyces lydicus TaxID=47763 RepID=UPI0037AF8F73